MDLLPGYDRWLDEPYQRQCDQEVEEEVEDGLEEDMEAEDFED